MFIPTICFESILTQKKHEIVWWCLWPSLWICLKEPTNLLPSTSVRDTKRKGSGSGWANIDICLSDFCAPLPMNSVTWRLIVISYHINVIILVVTVTDYRPHTLQQQKAAPAVEEGCQLLVTTQDDGWNMLKGLGIPTAKVFLFARIIASREPRPILGHNFQKVVVQVRLHLKWWLNLRPNIFLVIEMEMERPEGHEYQAGF